jgi:hypothetical protein
VTHIDFCPQEPYHYAVTASTRVRRWAALPAQQRPPAARPCPTPPAAAATPPPPPPPCFVCPPLSPQETPPSCTPLPHPQVMIYDGQTRQLRRTIARFKDKAYGGAFREDGKLLVAGGQDGVVQVWGDE